MNRSSRVALAALVIAPLLGAPAPPASKHLVINNTSLPLTCTYRMPGAAWQPWFQIAPAGNWLHSAAGAMADFQCRQPVRQVRYTVRPGTRYSLIRKISGQVVLIEVTAPQ
ncbi:MAG: hypothetical protein ACJ8E3_06000 [Sphingomicrobium sp.]